METSQILGQGTLAFLQGRIHQIEPNTTLRIEAFTLPGASPAVDPVGIARG